MTVFVLATAAANPENASALLARPRFRKATRAMALSYCAIEQILTKFSALKAPELSHRTGVMVGSCHGELEVTKEFLDCVGRRNIARPLLFQNSLHNATLGFITLEMRLTGAAMTLSNGQFSGEDALETARCFLSSGDLDICFAVGYDILVPVLEKVKDRFYPSGLKRGEGASAVLLANQNGLHLMGHPTPRAVFEGINYVRKLMPPHEVSSTSIKQPYYDSDGVERVHDHLESESAQPTITLKKPNGSMATIAIKKL